MHVLDFSKDSYSIPFFLGFILLFRSLNKRYVQISEVLEHVRGPLGLGCPIMLELRIACSSKIRRKNLSLLLCHGQVRSPAGTIATLAAT